MMFAPGARPATSHDAEVFIPHRDIDAHSLWGTQPMRKLRLFPTALITVLLMLAGLLAAPRGALAQQDASQFIQNLGTQGIQVLGPSVPMAQRVARFRQLFESDFDVAGITRFVLGPSGRNMTPEQQQEFATLFRDYVAQT